MEKMVGGVMEGVGRSRVGVDLCASHQQGLQQIHDTTMMPLRAGPPSPRRVRGLREGHGPESRRGGGRAADEADEAEAGGVRALPSDGGCRGPPPAGNCRRERRAASRGRAAGPGR